MKRRTFLTASCLAGVAPLSSLARADAGPAPGKKEYYELRLYHLLPGEKAKQFGDFLRNAAVPALNRIGISPVGVFQKMEDDDPNLYMLLPHKSLESVVTCTARLLADAEYCKAGAAVISAPLSAPAFQRIESSLSLAFDECPKVEIPTKKESRVLELRIYESHNAIKAKKKVEMFDAGGEIALFRKIGLPPVFFGETLVGTKIPNLTYMLGFDDMDALNARWKKFRASPGWEKLKSDPQYKDTVSKVTSILLRPGPGSQI